MEKYVNIEHYMLIEEQQKENLIQKMAIFGLLAVALTACTGITIPENCDESTTTIRGVANTLSESGYSGEMIQAEINNICR